MKRVYTLFLANLISPVTLLTLVGAVTYSCFAQESCSGKDVLTAKSCPGDSVSLDEQALFQLVTKYRIANGRPAIKLSSALSMVANRHLIDIKQNIRSFTHSWSNCIYDIKDEKSWHCVGDAPARLNSGYKGKGYETLYRTAKGNASPVPALEAWKKSALHNSIILNIEIFKDISWDELGVAVDGEYAALWFGSTNGGRAVSPMKGNGLGVSYDQAVAGLTKILSIDQRSSTVDSTKWQGYSTDKKIKLEIFGSRNDISEASVGISMKLEADGKMSSRNQTVLSTLLRNLFPEWTDLDLWIKGAVAAIAKNRTASKTKIVRKNTIELRSDGPNSLRLAVVPESKQKYVEIY
ncbi:MAG: CAP domain-containing protein [Pyrinomonadaceae bacterium]